MRRFRTVFLAAVLVLAANCGYSSRGNEVIAQVKKVVNNTPLICSDYVDTDLSLGVMRDGVGSMSTQDMWLTVEDKEDQRVLKQANESGALVKVTYDVKRVTWCIDDHIITKVEIVR